MSNHYRAVLWIDHHEARIIHFNATEVNENVIRPAHPPCHFHIKAGSASGTHQHGDKAFFHDVAEALKPSQLFMITGPSTAKTEFVDYLDRENRAMLDKLESVQAMPQMTDGELLATARRHFKSADRMRAQIG